jgi:hypothetical protein
MVANRWRVLVVVVVCVLSCVFGVGVAGAATGYGDVCNVLLTSFCMPGEFVEPLGVAVDNSSAITHGDVYVVNLGAHELQQFNAKGESLSVVEGLAGTPVFDAVDSSSDATKGDVYVSFLESPGKVELLEPSGKLVAGFATSGELTGLEGPAGVGVDPTNGHLFVAVRGTGSVNEYDSSGKLLGSFPTSRHELDGLAVDSSGDVFLSYYEPWEVVEYPAADRSAPTTFDSSNEPSGVGVDISTGDIYVAERAAGQIAVYEPEGAFLEAAGKGDFGSSGSYGLDVNATTHTVYASNREEGTSNGSGVIIEEGPLPEPPPVTKPVSAITATTAMLHGVLEPKGAELGFYFSYNRGVSCTGAGSNSTQLNNGGSPATGAVPVEESTAITGLEPSQHYTVCVLATNTFGATEGSTQTFTTMGERPSVDSESASAVNSSGVTLEAQINPNNQRTSYSFEYSTQATGEVLEGAITTVDGAGPLAGFGDQSASVPTGMVLVPGTTYFYRVIAENKTHEKTEGKVEHFTTVPTPSTDPVSAITARTAILNGHLTLGPVDAQYYFDYNTGAQCTGGNTTATQDAGTGTGVAPQTTEVTGLLLHTQYTVCFVTSNAFGSQQGSPVTFTTQAVAPRIEEEWVTHASATAATLQAKINPGGAQTTYRFEYATSEAALLAGKGQIFPTPPTSEGEAGTGTENVLVQEHPQGLQPKTNYWYRVFATSSQSPAGTPGPVETFTTRPAGSELTLPDNRAWELVSPSPGINGAAGALEPISEGGALIQAAEDGGAITYGVLGSVEAEPPGANNYSQVLSTRSSGGGWSSRDIATPHEQTSGVSIGQGQEYKFFSSDLSVGLVRPIGEPAGAASLSPAASEKTVYVRADEPLTPGPLEQGVFGEALAEGGYKALVTSKPGYENVPPGTEIGRGELIFEGASEDLSHVVLNTCTHLTATTPEGNPITGCGVYEWSGGRLQLISVLPDRQASEGVLGYRSQDARGAVSSNGTRIVWSNEEEHLYMRDVSDEQTVQLDENQGGRGEEPGRAQFQFASSDGTRVFFTDEEQLVAGSTAREGDPDLYECEMVEVGDKLECKLNDLTLDPHGVADVQGVVAMGSKEDINAYFVATGVLTTNANGQGEKARSGEDNLYLVHYDEAKKEWEEPVFIAALSPNDQPDWVDAHSANLEHMASRVSPNGEYLEFMSELELTGYDNLDASSGAADEEVFLYDAGSNRLVCASCNPTGERPMGVYDSENATNSYSGVLIDQQGLWSNRWVAADVPGWTIGIALDESRYQSRYLSDEGRLFFNSPDALVAQATNGLADVYEYEPVGVGGCEASSVTFSERSDGCVGLVSSGASGEESAFLDASENGDDVFFLSSARLTSEDKSSAFAVYDAHVCSALAPCSAEAASPAPCATEASCKAAPAPQPAVFGAGPSETFSGAGNPGGGEPNQPPPAVQPKVKSAKCKKGFTKKKDRCVKKKGKTKAKKAKRASYERGAGR